MANKMINCKICGAEIASSAKVCPSCGAKNKKPIYKKWWFYALVVVILLGVIGGSGGNGDSTPAAKTESKSTSAEAATKSTSTPTPAPTPTPITYAHYDVKELFDALKANAMKAQSTFKDQYVELEGYLGVIDSDGKYIGLGAEPDNYDYLFDDVQCYLKTDEQKSVVMELGTGDHILVRGKSSDVGEILGYSLKIDSIEKIG